MYSRRLGSDTLSFGVSGLLYRSNVLMYDHQSESLWSQIMREAVTGPRTGTRLEVLPSNLTTWEKWQKRYPESQVLTTQTGYARDYSKDPYADYYQQRSGLFGFLSAGPGEEDKELVVGVEYDGRKQAYPYRLIRTEGKILDATGEKMVSLTYDSTNDQLTVKDADGHDLPFIMTYWFVWKAFHPQTTRYAK